MSIKLMTDIFEIDFESSGEKFVLVALADNASDQGHCWPSQETIAKKTSLGVRNVRNHIHSLLEKGYIRADVSRGPGQSTRYWLNLTRIRNEARAAEDIPVETAGILKPVESAGIDRSNQPVITGQISRLTVIEPSEEPSMGVAVASPLVSSFEEDEPKARVPLVNQDQEVREKNHKPDPKQARKPATPRQPRHTWNVLEDDEDYRFEAQARYEWPGFDLSVAKLMSEKFYWSAAKDPTKQKALVEAWLKRAYSWHLEDQSKPRGSRVYQQSPPETGPHLPVV